MISLLTSLSPSAAKIWLILSCDPRDYSRAELEKMGCGTRDYLPRALAELERAGLIAHERGVLASPGRAASAAKIRALVSIRAPELSERSENECAKDISVVVDFLEENKKTTTNILNIEMLKTLEMYFDRKTGIKLLENYTVNCKKVLPNLSMIIEYENQRRKIENISAFVRSAIVNCFAPPISREKAKLEPAPTQAPLALALTERAREFRARARELIIKTKGIEYCVTQFDPLIFREFRGEILIFFCNEILREESQKILIFLKKEFKLLSVSVRLGDGTVAA